MRISEWSSDVCSSDLGTRIGGILRNSPEIAAVIIGTIIHDRCIVTLNPALPDETLAADIESLKTPAAIARSEDWQRGAGRGAVRGAAALGVEIPADGADHARAAPNPAGRVGKGPGWK